MTDAVKVARIHLVNLPTSLGMPWGILTLVLAINLVIFTGLTEIPEGQRATGALASIYIVTLVAAIQSVTQYFPFTAGLSLTRRAFVAGTAIFAAVQALVSGVVLTLLLAVENATDGWGLSLQFFGLFGGELNPVLQVLMYAAPFLLMWALGMGMGAVWKRWATAGLSALMVASILVVGGLVALITRREAWPAVGRFFTDTPTLMLTVGYPLAATVVLGAGAWLVLRRAAP